MNQQIMLLGSYVAAFANFENKIFGLFLALTKLDVATGLRIFYGVQLNSSLNMIKNIVNLKINNENLKEDLKTLMKSIHERKNERNGLVHSGYALTEEALVQIRITGLYSFRAEGSPVDIATLLESLEKTGNDIISIIPEIQGSVDKWHEEHP